MKIILTIPIKYHVESILLEDLHNSWRSVQKYVRIESSKIVTTDDGYSFLEIVPKNMCYSVGVELIRHTLEQDFNDYIWGHLPWYEEAAAIHEAPWDVLQRNISNFSIDYL